MLKNTTFMLVATLMRLATGVLLFVLLARAWGPDRFGVFMFAFTVASIAVMLVDYGFGLQTVRDVSRRPARAGKVIARSTVAKLVLAVILVGTYPLWARALPSSTGPWWLLPLLLLASIANSFALHLNLAFRSIGRFEAEAKVALSANMALLVAAAACLLAGGGLFAMALIFVVARLAHLAISLTAYRQLVGNLELAQASPQAVLYTLRKGLPFAIHVVVGTLYFQIDTLIVQRYLGATGVGLFQAGTRVMLAALVMPDVITNVYLPALAATGADTMGLATRMTRQLVTVGAAAFACLVLGRELIVQSLYGPGFHAASQLLPLFAIVVILRYAGSSLGLLLTTGDQQRVRSIAIVATMCVSVAVNLFLVPRFGLPGAVGAAIATNVFLSSTYALLVLFYYRRLPIDGRSIALLTMAAVLYVFGVRTSNGAVALALALPVIALLGISATDLDGVRRRAAGVIPAV